MGLTHTIDSSSWFPFLPALVTILVFILGFVINRVKDIAATSDRILSMEEFFFQMLHELCEDMANQVIHWRQLSAQFATKTRQEFEGEMETFAALPALLNVSGLDLFLAIVKSKNGDSATKLALYTELHKSPRTCSAIFEDSKKEFERFRTEYAEVQNRWDGAIRAIIGFKDSRISNAIAEGVGEPSQFLSGLAETAGNWQKKGTMEQNLTSEHLIRPLRQHAQQHIGNAESLLLLSHIDEADKVYDEFGNLLLFYARIFELSATAMEKRRAIIISKLNEAEALKRRKRWYAPLENYFRQWKEELP